MHNSTLLPSILFSGSEHPLLLHATDFKGVSGPTGFKETCNDPTLHQNPSAWTGRTVNFANHYQGDHLPVNINHFLQYQHMTHKVRYFLISVVLLFYFSNDLESETGNRGIEFGAFQYFQYLGSNLKNPPMWIAIHCHGGNNPS